MALPYPTKVVLPFDIATAQDMNERHANDVALAAGTGLDDGAVTAVKTSFGGNFTTTEVNTGFKWIDNSDIYKKTISIGALPNNAAKFVAHGITSLLRVIQLEGSATDGTRHHILPIPANQSNTAALRVSVTATDIDLSTNADWSSYTTAHVTLFYIKT